MLRNFFSSFMMAFESLNNNKVRATLTMLGIIIGVAAVITMTAIGQGAKKAVTDQIGTLGTNLLTIFPGATFTGGVSSGTGGSNHLTEADVEAMRKLPTISAVAPIVGVQAQIVATNSNWSTRVNGTSPDYVVVKNWKIVSGSNITNGDVRAARKVCILGKTVALQLFPDGRDPVGATIRIKHMPFSVIGVLEEKGTNSFGVDQDDIILAPLYTVMKKMMGITWLNVIIASAASESLNDAAVQDITQTLRQTHKLLPSDDNDFQVRSQVELAAAATQNANTLTSLLSNAAIISLLVGGIGIMNIMLVTVTERTREIGVRKSLGAKRMDIMTQFLTEAMALSIIGGVIGILLGMGMSWFISKSNGWTLFISPVATGLSFAAAAFIGIFFGYYPALKAAKMDPVEALRYE
jgi:putative ABC transport system permease protein